MGSVFNTALAKRLIAANIRPAAVDDLFLDLSGAFNTLRQTIKIPFFLFVCV